MRIKNILSKRFKNNFVLQECIRLWFTFNNLFYLINTY